MGYYFILVILHLPFCNTDHIINPEIGQVEHKDNDTRLSDNLQEVNDAR